MILKVLTEPAIIIITLCFLFFVITAYNNYSKVKKNLSKICTFLHSLSKKELSYRFGELDNFMINNAYISSSWEDFKKALIFPDKLYLAGKNNSNPAECKSDIYLTIDSSYFFNEETLVHSLINHKFIQIMPTILTGLGPFFTFLKIAIAFASIDFSTETNIASSLNSLISGIQIAALCSVFAVGFSLLFMFAEKIIYNRMCKKYSIAVQKEFIRLFDIVTSETFLIDLVKESKSQNINNEKQLKALPENFSKAFEKSISETTIPYLENILYSLNKIQENLNKGNNGDMVDKLF